jgi:hypothetical protein
LRKHEAVEEHCNARKEKKAARVREEGGEGEADLGELTDEIRSIGLKELGLRGE